MDPLTATAVASVVAKPTLKIISKFIQPFIKKIEDELTVGGKTVLHKIINGYSEYLDNAHERYSYFNSVVFKNEQKKLKDYYIPLTLIEGRAGRNLKIDKYQETEFGNIGKVLIVDTAGMGKTTLAKFLFTSCIEQEAGVPVFIELRRLSRKNTIIQYILEQLSSLKGKADEDVFIKLVNSGGFVFFLDGYDEIPEDERSFVTASIQGFIEKTPGNKFIITSRDEAGLTAFSQFLRFSIKPLYKIEAYQLLRKYSETRLADTLIEKLELDENHSIHEFLSNPLLTSLLYKSFEYRHTIPLKRHQFYRQVYEALYEAHDLTKEGGEFNRKKRSGLDIDRFDNTLRALGAITYKAGKVEFSKDESLSLINDAKKLAGEPKASPSNILHDITHAVPLFTEEGESIRWSHRSIQEYFSAKYICSGAAGDVRVILDKLYNDNPTRHANLILLCADINQQAFDQSIGRSIAIDLIAKYENAFKDFTQTVPRKDIEERKALTIGRFLFVVKGGNDKDIDVAKDGNNQEEDSAKESLYQERLNSMLQLMTEMIHEKHPGGKPTECTISCQTPAMGEVYNKLSKFISNQQTRVRLPFIEHTSRTNVKVDELPEIDEVVILDDSNSSPLNQPESFEYVNRVIRSDHKSWRFNIGRAREYVDSIERLENEKNALEPW